jgi:alpha-L-rhamnosidase
MTVGAIDHGHDGQVPGRPYDLRTDLRTDPIGIGTASPELAWRLPGSVSAQAAYQVVVTTYDGESVWDTGRVEDARPFGMMYGGPGLRSGGGYAWRVRVWDESAPDPGAWSDPADFETGILDPSEWRARWVSGDPPSGRHDYRPIYLRHTVEVTDPVVHARAYASALGWYRLFINGDDLTGPALVPRWTPFDEFVEYQVYDVTDAFRCGVNIVAGRRRAVPRWPRRARRAGRVR